MGNLLPEIKKQTGWVGLALDTIIQAATQFFEELKTTALAFQIESLQGQNSSFRSNSKPTECLFTNSRGEHRPPVTSSGSHGKHVRLLRLQRRQHSHLRVRRCTSMGKRSGKLHSDDGDWSPMASRALLAPGTGQLTLEHPSQATVEELCPLPAETNKTGSGQVP